MKLKYNKIRFYCRVRKSARNIHQVNDFTACIQHEAFVWLSEESKAREQVIFINRQSIISPRELGKQWKRQKIVNTCYNQSSLRSITSTYDALIEVQPDTALCSRYLNEICAFYNSAISKAKNESVQIWRILLLNT